MTTLRRLRPLILLLLPILAASVVLLLWLPGSSPVGTTQAAPGPSPTDPAEQELIDRLLASATGPPGARITVDYPKQQTLFPPEIFPPTFLWHDASKANAWKLTVTFADGREPLTAESSGPPAPQGEIDPRTIGDTNEVYEPTEYQATMKSWPRLWRMRSGMPVIGTPCAL